jgi:NTE family protein
MATKKEVNLVLAGGGVKGIALVGAIHTLEKAGYTFRRIAGTSAGAVVGGLLAAGYDGDELSDVMHSIPYDKFRDEGFIDRFGLPGKAISLLFEKGIYEGDFFCRWYDDMLGQKNIRTFADLQLDGDFDMGQGYKLVALAANLTRGKLLRFPWDLQHYDIEPDQQLVSEAVRASISLPVFYEPVRINGEYLVDGGILSNFAIDTFRGDPIPTIGIKLSAQPGATDKPHDITGPVSYGSALLKTMLSAQDQVHLNNPEAISRTIFVDTGNIMTTDFNLTQKQQSFLYDAGRHAATKFLKQQ